MRRWVSSSTLPLYVSVHCTERLHRDGTVASTNRGCDWRLEDGRFDFLLAHVAMTAPNIERELEPAEKARDKPTLAFEVSHDEVVDDRPDDEDPLVDILCPHAERMNAAVTIERRRLP